MGDVTHPLRYVAISFGTSVGTLFSLLSLQKFLHIVGELFHQQLKFVLPIHLRASAKLKPPSSQVLCSKGLVPALVAAWICIADVNREFVGCISETLKNLETLKESACYVSSWLFGDAQTASPLIGGLHLWLVDLNPGSCTK